VTTRCAGGGGGGGGGTNSGAAAPAGAAASAAAAAAAAAAFDPLERESLEPEVLGALGVAPALELEPPEDGVVGVVCDGPDQ
jgi:hypothetical protein